MGNPTLKTLWGIAKSPELHMSDEELHLFVQAQTGKGSLKELSKRELGKVIAQLVARKASAGGYAVEKGSYPPGQKQKIRALAYALGWEGNARINGMCKRMFGVNSIEWLNPGQCSKLIEALKNMLRRQKAQGKEEA